MTFILVVIGVSKSDTSSSDMLIYRVNNFVGTPSLRLYDPHHRLSVTVLTSVELRGFASSPDGRLAFSYGSEGDSEIYMMDTLLPESVPVNITQNPSAYEHPLAWSPDGRYLAFASYQEYENQQIYVWDGENSVNITPELNAEVSRFLVRWSFDGRLAFTISYDSSSSVEDVPHKIYLWDGFTTTTVNQNSTSYDSAPIWNSDNQLAFLSSYDDRKEIIVWDGISFLNGSPNVDTFTRIAVQASLYFALTWTSNNFLAFQGQSPQETYIQIYLWDGQTATNISQNPMLHNGGASWSNDGRWAFTTFFSSQQLVYVRDADNRTLLAIEGQYSPAWSLSGYLMFCSRGSIGWVLSMWDGQEVIEVTQAREISAQWQGGSGINCSSG